MGAAATVTSRKTAPETETRLGAGGVRHSAPGDIQDTPPPLSVSWGAGQSEGGRAAHPKEGGGGLS